MFAPDVDLGEQRHGDVVARLAVRVAEQPASPGRGQARYTLTVEGPPTLQLEAPRLEDAFAAWRVGRESSSWAQDGGARVEWSLALVQTKPGVVPLPGVRLRVRGGPAEEWKDASWPDPLHVTREVASVVEVEPAPPSPWPAVLQAASVTLAVVLAGLLLTRALRRRRDKSAPALTPAARVEARLAGSDDIVTITEAVRDFLDEHLGLSAARMTTAEVLAALAARGAKVERLDRLRRLFEQGDLVKFAGLPSAPAEVTQARALALDAVRDLATWPVGEMGASGEAG
jgi:hypothetical protein